MDGIETAAQRCNVGQTTAAQRCNLGQTTAAQRVPGWRDRLRDLVAARMHQPFAWGPADCVAWVCDAVQALHGSDTLAPLRVPRDGPEAAARQVLALRGTRALERCGLQRLRAPALAGVGDVVLLRLPHLHGHGTPLLGLCNGVTALAPGSDGLVQLPLRLAQRAWRV
jgi:hypothetical protein